jgi:hypothetical protein
MARSTLSKNPLAPLKQAADTPGARVVLYCAACTWSKSYLPRAIIGRLIELRRGNEWTSVGEVAGFVKWPCPACRRMRWGARFAPLEEALLDEDGARRRAIRNMRS